MIRPKHNGMNDFTTIVRGKRTIDKNLLGINLRIEFSMAADNQKNMSVEVYVDDKLTTPLTPVVDAQGGHVIHLPQQVGHSAVYLVIEGDLRNGQHPEATVFARVSKGTVNKENPDYIGLEDYMPKLATRHPEWFGMKPSAE